MMLNFKILSMNANSITGKLNLIKCYAETYNPDLVCICETKISDSFDDNELLGDKFTLWRKDRAQGAGGVLIAMKNDSNAKVLDSKSGPGECVVIKIQIHDKIVFNVVTFYRPPSEYELDNLKEIIETYSEANSSIIVGDFNLPDIEWSANPPHVKPTSNRKALHQRALDIITEADLMQFVHEPTHRLGNTLDLVLVNKALLDEINVTCDVMHPISDHNMLLIEVSIQEFSSNTAAQQVSLRKKYNFKKANFSEIEQEYSKLKDRLPLYGNVYRLWEDFDCTTRQALDNIPALLPKPSGEPWITRNIVRKLRKLKRLYDKSNNFPSITHQKEHDDFEKQLYREISKAKAGYIKDHLTARMEEGDPKPLYNYLKKHTGRSNNIAGLTNTDTEDIPNALANHFAKVYESQTLPIPSFNIPLYPPMDPVRISRSGVENLVNKLDVRKAFGPDNISSMVLKKFTNNVPSFIDCIVSLLSISLKSACLPLIWKKAIVAPIFKGGNRSDVNNYRPISLTCVLCKLLEHIISSNMWSHIDNYNIVTENQHGFRKNLNTTTQLLHVTHRAAEALDQKRNYNIVSFDFTKAFDRVPHELLVYKLARYSFDKTCVQWISDWLKGRSSVVSANGHLSKEFEVCSGVPQGSVLGPLLFLLYINDIHTNVIHSDCRLYADDTLLSCDITNDPTLLQKDVDSLFDWACSWGMVFNPRKCVHIQIGKTEPENTVILGSEPIPTSDCVKYLGVHIQSDLKWNKHISNITAKANRSLGCLRRNLSEAPSKTKLITYKTVVRPILEYATPVWSPHNAGLINSIDKVQRRAVRWTFRLKKLDSVTECMSRNELISLHDRRAKLDTLFLRKIEAGLYDIKLNTYVRFAAHHNTRGKVVSWRHNLNQWRYSYFNRVRGEIKVYFDNSTTNN